MSGQSIVMNCEDRDTELLLYELKELSVGRRLVTQWHLARCPRCRQRQAQLASASGKFAQALKPPGGGAGRPVGGAKSVPVWILPILLAVVALLLSVLVLRTVLYPSAPLHAPRHDDGCSPGLPNDKCR